MTNKAQNDLSERLDFLEIDQKTRTTLAELRPSIKDVLGGALDKFLGDGLMATFGTPVAGEEDAYNALCCAQAMMKSLEEFNSIRGSHGLPEIKAGFGLHYGPVVLGDIGANRLEFAVIGTTVNAASRLEALTRNLRCNLVASDELVCKAKSERNGHGDGREFEELRLHPDQAIRGLEHPISVWSQGARPE